MTDHTSSDHAAGNAGFDPHAVAIAKRQYFQAGEETVDAMFRRVANWVARPERSETRGDYAERFYELMASKSFCPGGRVLAGADTLHGNVLNCFVQDGSPEEVGTDAWVLHLASKLALVTKVGGGNGVNLDPIGQKRRFVGATGRLYLTIDRAHADYRKVATGTFLDLVRGEMVTRGYRAGTFVERDRLPSGARVRLVGDSVDDIWQAAADAVLALLAGNDIVIDLSDLRAEGTPVAGSGGSSSGPSSFAVEVYDNFAVWASLGGATFAGPVATLRYVFAPTLRAIRQGGTRRGAGMATISITHPDVDDFITAKDLEREREEGDISTFNISVLVSDEFMRTASGELGRGKLWEIAQHAWGTGEPGLIYVDRINAHNPMRGVLGDIKSTNPCGEIPLYPGEPCDLGALNLAAYVATRDVGLTGYDFDRFATDVATCVRFLDNVLDVNRFALEDNREMSMKLRRLGLGVMGLADALILMGYGYDSEEGRDAVSAIVGAMRNAAAKASEALAAERGAFPFFEESDLDTPRRNVAILTVAPTGTTSMLMGVSSGVEPVFAPFIYRKIGTEYHALIHPLFQELLEEHAPHPDYRKGAKWDWDKVVAAVQANHGSVRGLHFVPQKVRDVLACAHDISPSDHVRMQGVVQRAFDGGDRVANSISKTINLANSATVADVFDAYRLAFTNGCKGITVYRDGSRDFQVLSTSTGTAKDDAKDSQAASGLEHDDGSNDVVSGLPLTEQRPAQYGMAASAEHGTAAVATAAREPQAPQGALAASHASAHGQRPRVEHLPGEPLLERPTRLTGFTDSVKLMLPNGEKRGFYVTVNMQDELPAEVFIVSGKAGDEANADSEALGRVVSIALQYGVPAEALVKTLRGINGGMYGTYHGRMVASKADLLAVALETVGVKNVLNHGKTCPDCGAPLRFEEGCSKCENCGFSKCG